MYFKGIFLLLLRICFVFYKWINENDKNFLESDLSIFSNIKEEMSTSSVILQPLNVWKHRNVIFGVCCFLQQYDSL